MYTKYSSISVVRKNTLDRDWLLMLKDNLRLDGDDQDAYLFTLIDSCVDAVEGLLHRTICGTTVLQRYDALPTEFELVASPVSAFTSLVYTDVDDLETIVAPEFYDVDIHSIPARLRTKDTLEVPVAVKDGFGVVVLTYDCGWDTFNGIPMAIRQAVIMLAADLYEHSEANVELKLESNKTLQHLLAKWDLPYLGVK